MGKLLGIIILVLSLVLFPPAALAVVSNNAVPGDATYPIKRGLEDVIFAVASLSPTTKAWFAAARSDRRFQEVTVLIAQGKQASNTLNELVEQTQIAASQIDQVKDPVQKEKLISQLSESIAKYDAGLSQISAKEQQVKPQPTAVPQSSAIVPQPSPTSSLLPVRPGVSPIPQPTAIQSTPVPTPVPAAVLLPSPASAPSPSGEADIEKARQELERIKKNLEEQNSHSQGLDQSQDSGNGQGARQEQERNNASKKDRERD